MAIIGGGLGLYGARRQEQAGRQASASQMAFQERMRETQYQTAVQDMAAAGLNPALAYQQGGAGTPSGSTYQPPNIGVAATQGLVQGASAMETAEKTKLTGEKAKQEKLLTNYLVKNKLTMPQIQFTATNQASSEAYQALKTIFEPDPKATAEMPAMWRDLNNMAKNFLIKEGLAIPVQGKGHIPLNKMDGDLKVPRGKSGQYDSGFDKGDRLNLRGAITLTGKTPTVAQATRWLAILKMYRLADK